MVVVFALAGVPVWRLTRPVAAAPAVLPDVATPSPSPAGTAPLTLTVDAIFSPAPADFLIKNLDQVVLDGHSPLTRFENRWITTLPPEGLDLVVQAHWTNGKNQDAASPESSPVPSAAKITVHFPDGHQVEKSFWANTNGSLEEIFTLPGTLPVAVP